jgi:PAS domain S-box-containing protein
MSKRASGPQRSAGVEHPDPRSTSDTPLLRLIAAGTAWPTGAELFGSLVFNLAQALQASCAFLTEFIDGNTRARPLAFWNAGAFVDAPEYPLAGTPCESVLSGDIAAHSERICDLFPLNRENLQALGAESFVAVPMKDAAGVVLGHLAVIDRRARDWDESDFEILRIFGARAAGELGRRGYERALEDANARLQREIDSRATSETALSQSEKAYRGLYEDAPVAYWAVGTDRVVQRVNKRVMDLLGYEHDEIVGHSLADFTAPTPEGEGVAREVFARFLRGESTVNQEVEFRRKDGRSVWAQVSVTPVFNDRGEVEVTRSVVVDITERKRAERELEHRLALENLIATASSRFLRAGANVDAEIDRCMRELAGFFQIERMCVYRFTSDEQMAQHTHAWIAPGTPHPADEVRCADLPAVFRDVLAGRVIGARTLDELPQGYEPLRRRLERAGVRSVAILPLDYSNRVLGMLLLECAHGELEWSAEDLRLLRLLGEIIASTLARRDAEKALEDARRAAEAASRAKSEFLASMSHELRTPLNGILGYAQLLARDTQLESRHFEAVQGVQHCGEHLLELVNEVLDLARIEAGRVELRIEEVELAPLLDETADITRLRATQAGLRFVYETASTLPEAVSADPRRLKQILLNLLGNAVKFTPSGEVRFRVHGTRSPAGRWRMRFEIEDTGVGIAPDELPHIFDPFHRAPAERAVEGTGLGLAITRDLVEAMQGALQVESRDREGSLFVVELDLPEVDARVVAPARAAVVGYHGRRRVLLIADDNRDNRAVLRGLLEPLGFQIHEAASGREAIDVARRVRPDLILLDVVMPELDGFEVTRRLRLDRELDAVRIIAVSASVFDDTRQTSIQAGCDDFLAKPIELDAVLARLERHLGVQWICAGDPAGDMRAAAAQDSPLVAEVLGRLVELSRSGDIAGVNDQLAELERGGRHPRLVAELRGFARTFDMKAIRDRLQRIESPT